MTCDITAIILTYNESKHIERCINSVQQITRNIIIIDSYSSDNTKDLALKNGAVVLEHEWLNHAAQFNWALTQLKKKTDWIFRIDADEYLSQKLICSVNANLRKVSTDIDGIFIPRRMTFQGKLIKHGGVFPVKILRLFRYGKGQCENRWMDEHIHVIGDTINFDGELIDDNLNSLGWWVDKHNNYASREVVDILNHEYRFMSYDSIASIRDNNQASIKRWIKDNIYSNLPLGFRSFLYFFYRYVIRLGFLDGQAGTAFHFLQGFWYRYLVDSKLVEVRRYMKKNNCTVLVAIDRVLDIKIAES